MSDIKRLTDLSNPVAVAIETQLSLASTDARDALKDVWVLGYCLGMFDATAQRSNLDQDTEGLALITRLRHSPRRPASGAQRLKKALDSQEARIRIWRATGGNDLSWAGEAAVAPMSLFQRLIAADDTNTDNRGSAGRPESLRYRAAAATRRWRSFSSSLTAPNEGRRVALCCSGCAPTRDAAS